MDFACMVCCIAHFILLHILLLIFSSYFYLYLYIFSCVMFHFSHFPLSGPVLIYISLLIISCIIEYVTNKRTLNLGFAIAGLYSPPEPCEACFNIDGCTLLDLFWTVEKITPIHCHYKARIILNITPSKLWGHFHLLVNYPFKHSINEWYFHTWFLSLKCVVLFPVEKRPD